MEVDRQAEKAELYEMRRQHGKDWIARLTDEEMDTLYSILPEEEMRSFELHYISNGDVEDYRMTIELQDNIKKLLNIQ